MSTQSSQPQEEIDLGSLFSQIGNMFKNMFNAIGGLFKSIFHNLILFLLFIKKNSIVLGIATIIGIVFGFALQTKQTKSFSSKMQVETNFKSGNVLYNQIKLLNNLIEAEDSARVASIFGISPSAATNLLSFSIEAENPTKQLLQDYDQYMQETDTIYTKGFEFVDYKNRTTEKELSNHIITVTGKSAKGFDKLKEGFISLVENDFYKELREVKLKELYFTKKQKEKRLHEVDSLRKRYKEVALLQAKNKSNSTDVNFTSSNKKDHNYDLDLYNMSRGIVRNLVEIETDIAQMKDIIKIKSNFNVGVENNNLVSKAWFKYGVFGFLLALFVLGGLKFNKYLSNYQVKTE